jgi:glycosyltransferase involved in cell wall biosynthesis
VFVGSNREIWGEFERICKLIDELSLNERIHFLGYVDNADMPILFELAMAVTIIPLFGYGFTYPVLEAWQMKRPLICANTRESREQVEDAALFANPTDPKDIALKIKMLVNNKKLSERLVQNGLKQLQLNSHENLSKKIGELITMFDKEILRKTTKL